MRCVLHPQTTASVWVFYSVDPFSQTAPQIFDDIIHMEMFDHVEEYMRVKDDYDIIIKQ